MKKTLCLLALLTLAGCATVGRKLDPAKIDQIKKGETTREQVLKLIGSPDQMTRDGGGNVTFTYMYLRATTKPESFIPVVGSFVGGVNMQNQTLMLTFDPQGVVKDFVSSYGAQDASFNASSGGKPNVADTEKNKRRK